MKTLARYGLWGLLSVAVGLAACSDDPSKAGVCEGPACVEKPCNNPPDIVRVEFDPKEGKVPFDVTFNVKAEDPDDICPDPSYTEHLTYFWDIDGDGYVDRKTNTGNKITVTYDKEGDYKVAIWVVDAKNNASKKVTKFVRATKNEPPRILNFRADPVAVSLPAADITFSWSAFDPDGLLGMAVLDYGEGVTSFPAATFNQSIFRFRTPGDKTVKLTVFDADGAQAMAETTVVISINMPTSEFIQTVGTSTAFAVNDNEGNYYPTPYGPASYVYVADGEIALKALRYPLSAFEVGNNERPAELVGMADYGGDYGYWHDVVTYGDVAVVAGSAGALVYNVAAGSNRICKDVWDTNCYPGTPTQPAAVCLGNTAELDLPEAPFAFQNIGQLQLLKPSGTGQVWAVGTVRRMQAFKGGLTSIRIDQLSNPNGYVFPHVRGNYSYTPSTGRITGMSHFDIDSYGIGDVVYDPETEQVTRIVAKGKSPLPYFEVERGLTDFGVGELRLIRAKKTSRDCWHHVVGDPSQPTFPFGKSSHTRDSRDFLDADPTAFHIYGDFAFIGVSERGFRVYNLGEAYRKDPQNPYQGLESSWQLRGQPGWFSAPKVTALTVSHSRPVTGELKPTGPIPKGADSRGFFRPFSELSDSYQTCLEPPAMVNPIGSSLGAGTATLATPGRRFFANNRIAIELADGTIDDNDGSGFLVLSDYTADETTIEGTPSAPVAEWRSVHLHGISHFSILPSYPGSNPVSFATSATATIGRSAQCFNFVYAYDAVTQPVAVSFSTAPLLIAGIDDLVNRRGIYIFDVTTPDQPVQLNSQAPVIFPSHPPRILTLNDDWVFMGYGDKTRINMLDISDPYHLQESWTQRGARLNTYKNDNVSNFLISDLAYVKTPSNEQGVLMVASGPMGMNALSFDTVLKKAPDRLEEFCGNESRDSMCMVGGIIGGYGFNDVPGLQLRHDGGISNITLVENKYALVSQTRGGVLVYDVSGVQYGGNPTFVSHIRTQDSPGSLRYTQDDDGTPHLFLADASRYYLFPFTDPARPDINMFNQIPGVSHYSCADSIGDNNLLCSADALYYSKGWGAPDFGHPFNRLYLNHPPTTKSTHCNFTTDNQFTGQILRLQTDILAGRMFFFAQRQSNSMMGEIRLDTNGDILEGKVGVDGQGNDIVAGQGCLWSSFDDALTAYQSRPGIWKRFYTSSKTGWLKVWDIDSFEQQLATNQVEDLKTPPDMLGQINLGAIHNSDRDPVSIMRMVPVGPYLFVAANESGGWVLDMSQPFHPRVIGRTSVSIGKMAVTAINALVFPVDKNDPSKGHVYLALVADNAERGGIQLIRFEGLQSP